MTVPTEMYNFILRAIRDADQKDGHQFFERYFMGAQNVWETIDAALFSIPNLWSIEDCPDEYLQYLKWIVGWTSELESITYGLSYDELRRLIAISGRLWKLRGTEDTIIDVLKFATGARCRYWNWFDYRWIVDETIMSEEHDGHDPWMTALPDPASAGAEYESTLRIVDNGTLNKDLVVNLMKLMRAAGERWEIFYLGFLDQFIIDGDTAQWQAPTPTASNVFQVSGGVMRLGVTATGGESTYPIVSWANWDQMVLGVRIRAFPLGISMTFLLGFHYMDSDNYSCLQVFPSSCASGPMLRIVNVFDGTPTVVVTVVPTFPLYDEVWYYFRISVARVSTGREIKVYVDSNELINVISPSKSLQFENATFDRDSDAYMLSNGVLQKFESDFPAIDEIGGRQCVQIFRALSIESVDSEVFNADDSDWENTGINVTDNAALSPLGDMTADAIIENTSTGYHEVDQTAEVDGSSQYYSYIFVKANGRDRCRYRMGNNAFAGNPYSWFNLATGEPYWTVDCDDYGIIPLSDGWFLIYIAATSDAVADARNELRLVDDEGDTDYTGDNASGFYVWGGGIVKSPYLPPYIYAGATPGSHVADKLEWSQSQVAAESWVRDRFAIAVYPNYSSDQISEDHVLFNFNDSGGDVYGFLASDRRFYIHGPSGQLLQSEQLTWDAFQKLEISIQANNGTNSVLTIAGLVTNALGIPFSISDGSFELGARSQTSYFDGKISEPFRDYGNIGLGVTDGEIEVDEVELFELPASSDYIDINS